MFRFLIEYNLIFAKQSGPKPEDSCINQLLSITHKIHKSFDDGFEVRGVFLNISKAFDKVWHKGIIFKLKQNGISGKLTRLRLGLSYLREHKFKHSFQDTLNPFCSCGVDVKTNMHFFSLLPLGY